MKAFWKASAACLCFIFVFLYAWQYVVDPRAQEGPPAKILEQISRTIFGERCLETYKISNRQNAVAYARNIWQVEKLKLAVLGDDDVVKSIFESALFRDDGDVSNSLLCGCQMLILRSALEVASCWPSGEKAMVRTREEVLKLRKSREVRTSQTSTAPLSSAEAIWRPFV